MVLKERGPQETPTERTARSITGNMREITFLITTNSINHDTI